MSNTDIILQIFFITVGMFFFSLLLNRILKFRQEDMKELRERALDLQERMKNAQNVGDPKMMQQLQVETTLLMKAMMKKQLIPLSLRCVIFWVIFAIIGFIYAGYSTGLLPFPILFFGNGWVAIYVLFSLGISLLYYVLNYLYKKVTGKGDKKDIISKEIMGMLPTDQSDYSDLSSLTPSQQKLPSTPQRQFDNELKEKKQVEKKDSWKDRIRRE